MGFREILQALVHFFSLSVTGTFANADGLFAEKRQDEHLVLAPLR